MLSIIASKKDHAASLSMKRLGGCHNSNALLNYNNNN